MKTRKAAALTLGVLLIVIVSWSLFTARKAYAQPSAELTIPKSYGALKGCMEGTLIFEDNTGTLHLVHVSTDSNWSGFQSTIHRR